MSFSFLHVSDLHYRKDPKGARAPFSQVLVAMDSPLCQMKELLVRLDRPVDFVIITGDLVHDGDREDYISLKAQLDGLLDVPYFVVSGNHDDGELVREVFLSGGGLSYVRELPFVRLIALDTSAPNCPDGMVDRDGLRLLEQVGRDEKPTIVFTHHHLFRDQFVLPPAQGAEELLEVLEKAAVEAVLCGHTHHYFQARIGTLPYYTAGSLSFAGENGSDGSLSFYQNSGATLFVYSDGTLSAHPVSLGPEKLLCKVNG